MESIGVGGGPPPQATPAATAAGTEITLLAPAKINLSLEILRRRSDGYHDLASVMQAIDLVDDVCVRTAPGAGITLRARGEPVPPGAENIAWQAARIWLDAASTLRPRAFSIDSLRIEIDLRKRIPVGAGLGGGSADAAAVLLALNRLSGRPLGARALHALGARLGSDVPFFLVGGTCVASGRGERLRRLPPLPPIQVILVSPAIEVSTAWAYAARGLEELTATGASTRLLESTIRNRSMALIGRYLVNDLERVVARKHGVVAEVLEGLRGARAIGACMSGSGSSAFALVEDHAEALRLAETLRRMNHPVRVCHPFRRGSDLVAGRGLPDSVPH